MKHNSLSWLRNIVAFCLVLTVFAGSTLTAFAKSGNKFIAGELTITGQTINGLEPSVSLDGEKSVSGRTVFSGSQITTSENATATVRLGNLGHLTVSPNSILNLNFDENSISGVISAGDVQVFNNQGVNVNIEKTGNANVNLNKAQDDDDDDDDGSLIVPLLVFAGIVTGTIIYVATKGDSGATVVVSPVR